MFRNRAPSRIDKLIELSKKQAQVKGIKPVNPGTKSDSEFSFDSSSLSSKADTLTSRATAKACGYEEHECKGLFVCNAALCGRPVCHKCCINPVSKDSDMGDSEKIHFCCSQSSDNLFSQLRPPTSCITASPKKIPSGIQVRERCAALKLLKLNLPPQQVGYGLRFDLDDEQDNAGSVTLKDDSDLECSMPSGEQIGNMVDKLEVELQLQTHPCMNDTPKITTSIIKVRERYVHVSNYLLLIPSRLVTS